MNFLVFFVKRFLQLSIFGILNTSLDDFIFFDEHWCGQLDTVVNLINTKIVWTIETFHEMQKHVLQILQIIKTLTTERSSTALQAARRNSF